MPVRRLTPADAPALKRIRDRALRESPEAFAASIEEDAKHPPAFYAARLAEEQSFTYGAFMDGELLGMAGGAQGGRGGL